MVSASPWRRAAVTPRWPEVVLGAGVVGAVLAAVAAPLASLLLGIAVAVTALLVKRPFFIAAALIVCMGNVKANYYLGFFTVFPEYLVLAVAASISFVAWLARPAWPPERRLALVFMLWIATGILSVPFAASVSKVLSRVVLIGVAGVTFFTVIRTVDTLARLRRAVALWGLTATLYACYGIVQMVGLVAGFDTSVMFLSRWTNPDIYLGVGAPVRRRIGDVFRANAMFNDPNILGGYLAAAITLMLALRFHHAETGRRVRARWETVGLFLMAACLLLTQSRSGVLATLTGAAIVLAHRPRVLRRPALWIAAGVSLAAMVGVALVVSIDPTLLASRFAGTGDLTDPSNRQHLEVFQYGLELIARYPLTGVGLGNFGLFYGPERDAYFVKMMTHCAPLTYFAESGIPGGLAFSGVWALVLHRVWRGAPARGDALGETLRVALFSAVISLLVANLFYDYILRTFIWVIAGLAVCVARLVPERGSGAAA